MKERCINAYRKKNDVSVHCKAIDGEMDYCGHQYMCSNTKRWEVNALSKCKYKNKPAVK